MPKETIIKIILVVLLAFILRVLFLDSTPPGLYVDEAAIGYNAYSIVHTGRDEHGHKLPLFLESYGTFTSGLVAYFVAVPIFFDLSVWSLRITPVILGTLSVLLMIILTSIYLRSSKNGIRAGLIFATAPSHVLWSRAFYEPTLGLLLFLIGLCRSGWLQMLFLSLSVYAYQPLRLIVYVYVFILLVQKKLNIRDLLFFGLTQIPMFYLSIQPEVNSRGLSLLWWNIIPHNPISIVREFLSQYLAYFSPSNLFWYPDPDLQRSLPLLSVYYSWQVIPYLVGLWKLPSSLLTLYLLFPLSAALTRDPFSTVRAMLLYIPITIIIVRGLHKLNNLMFGLLIVFSLFWLTRSLFVLLPRERLTVWNAGYKELFTYLNSQNKPAVVDVDKPVYILKLFYAKQIPQNLEFRPLVWKEDVCRDQLIVGTDLLVSENQAREHYLDFQIKIEPNLMVYSTNPLKKCKIK